MTDEPRPDLFSRPAAPRVFTVPPGVPFLPTLAAALLDGRLVPGFAPHSEPLGLARATIFLPTRRAARALADHLVAHAGVGALFLPRIVPLGDVDEDTPLGADEDEAGPFEGAGAALPPPIPATERRLTLTRLVLAWAKQVDRALLKLAPHEPLLVPASPADALALAGDLERLMDHMTAQGVDWDALAATVEARHSAYFGITLAFLRIVTETWPAILAERGASDPTARRNALILAEAARLAGEHGGATPLAPMIAAGSTGSMPATARLLAAIARLPNGTVVLPGLDQDLDDASFDLLTGGGRREGPQENVDEVPFGHPQTAMARLLATIGIDRQDVAPLGIASPAACARNRLLSEALRPAATTELWAEPAHRPSPETAGRALAGIAIVEAADEREEALAAAIAIRETLEDTRATVALVTPDRGLAERVCAELGRWGIDADDSAGRPLARTGAGRLARLLAEAAAGRCAARPLVALITHPLATFGLSRRRARRAAAALEIGLLRGPEPPPGLAGLRTVLPERRIEAAGRHAPRPMQRLGQGDWELAAGLIDRLEAALAPLSAAAANGDLVALAAAHRQAVLAAAAGEGERATLAGPDADALFALFDDLAAAAGCDVPGGLGDYPSFFARLSGERVARQEGAGGDRRVRVLGLLEARLVHVDRMILGGLDEAVWPPAARTDSFINRPMAAALGLPPPERRIGQTAHDFVAALGTADAVITRAAKRGGAPTVPSRFLQRLKALADDGGPVSPWAEAVARGRRYLAWAGTLDATPAPQPIAQPAPLPPADLVPRSLSVTEVETLVRDPYAVFAKHVLRLDPLDDLAVPPGAADRGTIIHDVLGRFAERWPAALAGDPTDELVALGREAFAGLAAYPDVAAQWWPRFERVARAFAQWELARRPGIAQVFAEVSGSLELALAGGATFTLRARADRIELKRDGGATVVDFKTGSPPTAKEVFVGFAPQLTLEAAMLRRGAFAGVPAGNGPAELVYVQANGGAPPLRPRPLAPPPGEARTVAALIEEHLARFEALIARYVAGELPFRARPFAKYAKRYNDYDHLARVREWSLASAEAEP